MTKADRLKGSILAGAIGDAWGSGFENQLPLADDTFYLLGNPFVKMPEWGMTDDTQLTLATLEVMTKEEVPTPETTAIHFLQLYQRKKLRGLGASTLKALRELEFGGHWSQVGRRGEYAAGNGAAMRIAPLAFVENISRTTIREICSITHDNDEAYIGALSVVLAIKAAIKGDWQGDNNLISLIVHQIPDTRIRDRLLEIESLDNLQAIGELGNSGYVVDTVPLAIAAANQVRKIGLEQMFQTLIDLGGDTDTNCSIAGQIAGALIGKEGIPNSLREKLSKIPDYPWIIQTINAFLLKKNW